jgi:glycosyltransferase involved in cell wall biosynthesis
MPERAPVTAVILTYNEEQNLPKCLVSLVGWVNAIYVVDSGSTDGTVALARQYGAEVVEHPFEWYSKQWRWALQNLPIRTDWVLGLDADQRVTPELAEEITEVLRSRSEGVDGWYVTRRYIFRGRWIKHGGQYPKYVLKLFRAGKVYVDDEELLDHHFYVKGRTAKLNGEIIEENLKERDLFFWVAKHIRHTHLRVQEERRWRFDGRNWPIAPSLWGSPDERTLWLRRVWLRLPLFVRPWIFFFYRYFLQLGFLDGAEGLVFHLGLSLWFPLLVDLQLRGLLKHKSSV